MYNINILTKTYSPLKTMVDCVENPSFIYFILFNMYNYTVIVFYNSKCWRRFKFFQSHQLRCEILELCNQLPSGVLLRWWNGKDTRKNWHQVWKWSVNLFLIVLRVYGNLIIISFKWRVALLIASNFKTKRSDLYLIKIYIITISKLNCN